MSASRISILIVVLFFALLYISENGPEFSDVICARKYKGYFTWNVHLPLFGVLLIFNSVELMKFKKGERSKLEWLLLLIIPLFVLYFIVRSFLIG